MLASTLHGADWSALGAEALGHLLNLLRIDTSNPPGNEAPAAAYLERVLRAEGIPCEIIESAPGRANLFARLDGGNPRGGLILSSHLDVVPAEPELWKHPPFGGEVHDGCIWGRGAIDMKHFTINSLMTVILLKRLRLPLVRDVVFAAIADEEAGMDFGSAWLVDNRPDLLQGEYCLTEGGGATGYVGNRPLYTIQAAAKGVAWLRVSTTGAPGHGSMPHADNAVVRLGRVLARLGSRPLPFDLRPSVRTYLAGLAGVSGWRQRLALHLATVPFSSEIALRHGALGERVRALRALLRNTVSPTGLTAGRKENVIPSRASAILDGRLLPGTPVEEFLRQIRAIAREELDIEILRTIPAVVQEFESPLYDVLAQVVKEQHPGCAVVPGVLTGLTDAAQFQRLGLRTYGFAPLKIPPDFPYNRLFHGHDERIPVEGFLWGLQTLFEAVRRFCAPSAP